MLRRLAIPLWIGLVASALASVVAAADRMHMASVPALGVSMVNGRATGRVHYIVVQVDQSGQGNGPVVQFNEMNLGGGSHVDGEWKDGVWQAVDAARHALGEDGRAWVVTIKNRSYYSVTGGSSASAAVACAIIAARRGDALRPGVVLTGTITADGQIGPVGFLPAKVEAAAQEHMHTVLIPQGQAQTAEWDLQQLGRQRNIRIVEVGTLRDAYDFMTGSRN